MSTKCTYLFGQRSISNSRVKRAWSGVVERWVTSREVVSETVGEAHGPIWTCEPRERAWVTHRERRSGRYTSEDDAAVLYAFILPLVELTYKEARQEITFPLVLKMQMVMCRCFLLMSCYDACISRFQGKNIRNRSDL
ncbi:unnamed protein product [Microthlaspi erraticum]|uniref:Uncharacterized protein n=1 Tax=Microthlaspi erraticum TaxID=1685480 RepID=A0A6D2IT97_9BRAS|nr:unnamed protein product [Microthlaspi erraticum]